MFKRNNTLNTLLIGALVINVVLFAFFVLTKSYPIFPMLIHGSTLLILWGYLLKKLNLLNVIKTHWKENILLVFLLLTAFFIRMDRLEVLPPGIYPDELHVVERGLVLMKQNDLPPFLAQGYYHPTPLLYITTFSVNTLGRTITAVRLPNVIIGSLTVVLFYIVLRFFSQCPLRFLEHYYSFSNIPM